MSLVSHCRAWGGVLRKALLASLLLAALLPATASNAQPSLVAQSSKPRPGQGHPGGTSDSPTITPGDLALSATFNSISIDLPFAGDTNGNATADLAFRKSGDTDWRQGIPLWRTDDGTQPAFFGSALLLDPGTSYDVQVTVSDPDGVSGQSQLVGTVATRSEDIPAASAVAPTEYVSPTGDDSADGSSPATAWKTLDKVFASAPDGAIVQLAPGQYTRPATARKTGLSLVAQYPAVDDNQNVINPGQHSIVLGRQTVPGDGSWQTVTPDGDPTHVLYLLKNAGVKTSQLGYSDTQLGEPQRVANWQADKNLLNTAAGFATTLYTNQTYNYGFWIEPATGDLYLRLPPNAPAADPSLLYVTLGDENALPLAGPNQRVSGLEVWTSGNAINLTGSSGGVVDHNLIGGSLYPVRAGAGAVIENNIIENSNLRTDPSVDASAYIRRRFIKGDIVLADGTVYKHMRIGQQSEVLSVTTSKGSRDVVVRQNLIQGNFHGVARGSGDGPMDAYGWDIYNNTIQYDQDDAFAGDGKTVNWRIWNNTSRYTLVGLSTGPVGYGPIYLFRNTFWRIGSALGGFPPQDPSVADSGVGFKYSGSSHPQARIYVLENTMWTDDPGPEGSPGVDGGAHNAGGCCSPEGFYLRNNILRFTRYAFSVSANQPWDENYDAIVTTDTVRGLGFHRHHFTGDIQGYRAESGQGNQSNAQGDFASAEAVDSQFVDAAHGDLRLRPDSALVSAGVSIPNLDDLASLAPGGASLAPGAPGIPLGGAGVSLG